MSNSFITKANLLRTGFAVLAGIAACISVAIAFDDALHISEDLQNILKATSAFWQQQNPYHAWLAYEAGGARPAYEPNYLPPMYFLMGGILWLDWPVIKASMALLNVTLGAGLMILLQRLYLPNLPRWQTFLLVCALLTSTPFRSLVAHGQTALVGLFCVIAALYFLKQAQRTRSILLLFVALMKYSVSAPLLLVFARETRWRIAIVAGLGHILLVVVGAIWLGSDPLSIVRDSLASNRYLIHQGFMNYSNILLALGEGGGQAGLVLSGIIILAACALALLRRHTDDLLCLSLFTVASALCLYHTGYDMVMYAIPLVLVLRTLREKKWSALPLLERVTTGLLALVIALVWWGLETIENHLMPWLAQSSHGGAVYDEPHAVEVWYVLMFAVTAALVGLFVMVWRASMPLRLRAAN